MDHTRQLDIIPASLLAAVHFDLVGVGGIGSPTGMALTEMGASDLRVFDFDTVAEVNLASQLYREQDIGVLKVFACQAIWRDFSQVEVEAIPERAEGQNLRGIVVLGVDSMSARKAIWESSIRDRPQIQWLIDARMGAETGTLFTIKPGRPVDQRYYEISLYADDEAMALPCTGRAVVYNTLWLAALIGRLVKRLVMNQPIERRLDFDLDSLSLIVE